MKKYLLFCAYFLVLTLEGQAQVKFHLVRSPAEHVLTVQVIPEQTYQAPMHRIGTAQVTLQVPTGMDFSYSQLEPGVSGVKWEVNSVVRNPAQLPGFDLYSFGLMTFGTDQYMLEAQRPTTLFRLTGLTHEGVELLSSQSPILARVGELKVNIGNQFNVLGYRQGLENAYHGNLSEKHLEPSSDGETVFITQVFPNPAREKTQVGWENYSHQKIKSFYLKVAESTTGRVQWTQDLSLAKGRQYIQLDTSRWPRGMYIVTIFRDGEPIGDGARLFVTE